MKDVKYPNIKVRLGGSGNAFAILGAVKRAMQKEKLTKEQIDEFITEAQSGDYDNLLVTCMRYVEVS